MTLNEAIYLVLISKFKKDCPKAFQMVENAGYDVYKSSGVWIIKNPKINKTIRASEPSYVWENSQRYYKRFFYHGNSHTVLNQKIDFVNCLNTPINEYANYTKDIYFTKYKLQISNIRQYKNMLKWRTKDIEKCKEKVADAQEELIRAVRFKTEAEMRLNQLRKEFKKGE